MSNTVFYIYTCPLCGAIDMPRVKYNNPDDKRAKQWPNQPETKPCPYCGTKTTRYRWF